MTSDHLLVSTGRRPYSENLGLEDVKVKKDEKGRIIIDKHF
jgi:dihydrolipoamide dehydrogenase